MGPWPRELVARQRTGRLSLHPPREAFPKLTMLDSDRMFTAQSEVQLSCPGRGSCGLLVCQNSSSGTAIVRICVLTHSARIPSTLPYPWCHRTLQKALTPPQTHHLAPSVPVWRAQAVDSLNSDLGYTSTRTLSEFTAAAVTS